MGAEMDRPLVSIIVPVYNVESYLPQCIESILAQTYENLEIILVDDGSADSSGRICEEYADRDTRIQTIHNPNEGLAAARNQGLEVARGVYCSFVDSDDYIARDCIAYLYDMAIENNAQIAVCGYQKVYGGGSGNVLAENVLGRSKKKKAVGVYDTFSALSALLYQGGIIASAWGRLFRRKLFSEIRFPKGRQHEDVAVMYQLFDRAEKIVVGSEKKYFYLQNPAVSFILRLTKGEWIISSPRRSALNICRAGIRNLSMRQCRGILAPALSCLPVCLRQMQEWEMAMHTGNLHRRLRSTERPCCVTETQDWSTDWQQQDPIFQSRPCRNYAI